MKESNTKNNVVRLNHNIRCPNIMIVGTNTILSNKEAQALAAEKNLDLLEVNFIKNKSGTPISICKLLDYGKYIYDKKKSEKLAAKKARSSKVETKIIKFHITSDTADVSRKCKNIIDFLNEGNKVKIEIFLRGKEQRLDQMIRSMMNSILDSIKEVGVIEIPPKYEGRSYSSIVKKLKS